MCFMICTIFNGWIYQNINYDPLYIISRISIFCCNEFEAMPQVGSVVEWLKRRAYDQHGLGSKPNRALLLCP